MCCDFVMELIYFAFNKEFGSDPKIAFTPVLEPDIPGAFITQFSRDVIPEYSLKIPLLIGVNSDEGVIKSSCEL